MSVGLPRPSGLHFVALDFEKEQLNDRLPQAGFSPPQPAFFSWLGVSMYLPAAVVMSTLKSVSRLAAAGSTLVFDYQVHPELLSPRQLLSYQVRQERVASLGEPWKSNFDPGRLWDALGRLGLTVEEDLGAQAINARYFSAGELRVRGGARLIKARKDLTVDESGQASSLLAMTQIR